MQLEKAVRETYRIVGEVLVTQEDFAAGRVYEDAVGYNRRFGYGRRVGGLGWKPVSLHGRRG